MQFSKSLECFAQLVSLRTCISYRLFLMYIDRVIYSTLIVDVTINFYLHNIYAIDSLLYINTYSRIDFRSNLLVKIAILSIYSESIIYCLEYNKRQRLVLYCLKSSLISFLYIVFILIASDLFQIVKTLQNAQILL